MTTRKIDLVGILAILFDLDGTLRHTRPSHDQTIISIACETGLDCTEQQRHRAIRWGHYYWAQSPELKRDLTTYADSRDALITNYVRRFAMALGCEPDKAEALAPRMYHDYTNAPLERDYVPPEVPTTLDKLRRAGFTLGVVSNRDKPINDDLVNIGLNAFFEFALASCEVNSLKPEEKIFRYALDLAGTSPDQTLFIGDNYYADIIGAKRAGLVPVLVDPDGVFPDADCTVIRSVAELAAALD